MADLKSLIRKRASLKANLTIFTKFIADIQGVQLTEAKVIEVESRLQNFESVIDSFEEIQTQIDILSSEDEVSGQFAERESFKNSFFAQLSAAKQIVKRHTYNAALDEVGSTGGSIIAPLPSHNTVNQNIKLPTIQIPKFDGKYETWMEFRDTFESLIHENKAINDIEKFHYLRASLTGGAAQVIKSLEFSAQNYDVAWSTLCDRYNNTRILVHNHVNALFNIESITKESSHEIRKIIDMVNKHLRSLDMLGQPTEHWDILVIHLITTKLDKVTTREWEQQKIKSDVPDLQSFLEFLKHRADLLETLGYDKSEKRIEKPRMRDTDSRTFLTANITCSFCKGEHHIAQCAQFLKLSINERSSEARKRKLCTNCLRIGHFSRECRSSTCRKCNKSHNTLLHFETQSQNAKNNGADNTISIENQQVTLVSHEFENEKHVLLSTALVDIFDRNKKPFKIRVLLDVASQSSFITTSLCQKLDLPKTRVDLNIGSINHTKTNINNKCVANIKSRYNNFAAQVTCLVIPEITGVLPNFTFNKNSLNIPKNIRLADPTFDAPSSIDMLLGADHFWNLLSVGQIALGTGGPILQKSRLGWIIGGRINANPTKTLQCNFIRELSFDLNKFWQLEEGLKTKALSTEEKECEQHFLKHTKRDQNGRFIVTIPLKQNIESLGDSKATAHKRFLALERKLEGNPKLKQMYNEFLDGYQSLGHMVKVDKESVDKVALYLPHHGILKEHSITTKLRVVFDASAQTTSGVSFNDLQMVGPTIQTELVSILIRFRKHNYVLAADIEKMYRMVLVTPEQRSLQRILWRSEPTAPLDTFELQTITYGTASAPFLAIRALHQLGIECEATLPDISNIIKHDFYVDDLLSGAETREQAIRIGKLISHELSKGCFSLRKWISNDPTIITDMELELESNTIINFGENENTKTLGLIWSSQSDKLLYKINESYEQKPSKRTVLSEIAQIFDPLGLVSCCTIVAKMLMQNLWAEKLSWDESLPAQLHTRWLTYRKGLGHLNTLRINRKVMCTNPINIQIHGFSDASALAYGACVYLRSEDSRGDVLVRLICAKGKVAPLKPTTIPRLELCGALTLANLVEKVRIALNIHVDSVTYWTDSTIIIGWINTQPNVLQTFVCNRVAQIQELTNSKQWRHVPTACNPADLVSRGVLPTDLGGLSMWWEGPDFLSNHESEWPKHKGTKADLPEQKQGNCTKVYAITKNVEKFPFDKCSSLLKLIRIVAYWIRFKNNCLKSKSQRNVDPLSALELAEALNKLVKISQRESFEEEISCLQRDKQIPNSSRVLSLTPFFENDLLRVGGRLTNSNLEYDKKHPIVLSAKHPFTKLLMTDEHIKLLHCGPQMLLFSIREKYWPIGGRNLAKQIVHGCIKCFKVNPRTTYPIMGNLPQRRVQPAPPFFTTGVDYAGPLHIKNKRGRGAKTSKCYICVFVCFVTKAIHLEIVNDLSTESFLATFKRFIARRGKPKDMYSDNATNFTGANSELRALYNSLNQNSNQLVQKLANEGITWHFIPARSPHFGGLWEASVKSMKQCIKRVAGNIIMTFDELHTLIVQVESILNSRPLSPLSSDVSDITPLTPAHFLIGRPLTSIPEPDYIELPTNRLSRYQHVQQMIQHIWRRWSKEYISGLQQKQKWHKTSGQLTEGSLVLLKDDNLPPLKWAMGRVTSLHPGKDNVIRVASIQTANGVVRRSVTKICSFPSEFNEGAKNKTI